MDGTGLGSCPVVGFGTGGIESSGSATRVIDGDSNDDTNNNNNNNNNNL
jgi:hypothetical protein